MLLYWYYCIWYDMFIISISIVITVYIYIVHLYCIQCIRKVPIDLYTSHVISLFIVSTGYWLLLLSHIVDGRLIYATNRMNFLHVFDFFFFLNSSTSCSLYFHSSKRLFLGNFDADWSLWCATYYYYPYVS